jgi:hypothetical protein
VHVLVRVLDYYDLLGLAPVQRCKI